MRPDIVVVVGLGLEDLAQVGLAKDDEVIQAFSTDRADEPFGMAILPSRTWRGRVVADAHGSKTTTGCWPVRPVAIPKQIARRLIPGECLGDLARDPFRSRIRG